MIPLTVLGEVKRKETYRDLKAHIDKNKIEIFKSVPQNKFIKLKDRYPQLGNGEIETILCGEHCKEKKYQIFLCIG